MNHHLTEVQRFSTLEKLRAYHNERFIRLAYRSILGREPDAEGLKHYLSNIPDNISPAGMLSELRSSAEYKIYRANFTGSGGLPMSNSLGILYYYVEHTVQCPANTGMQRVVRMLAKALIEQNEQVRFVKWGRETNGLVYINRDELKHLAEWNGPIVHTDHINLYPEGKIDGDVISVQEIVNNSWLLVPEVTHITYHNQPKTLEVLTTAKQLGLKSAFIFYDAIPLRREELIDSVVPHSDYMRHLKSAEFIIPISEWSGADFVNFENDGLAVKSDGFEVKVIPLPSESILGVRVKDFEKIKANVEHLIISVGSITPHKNQLKLVRAFNAYCNKTPNTTWRLELIGHVHPAVLAELNQLISDNGRVSHFPGAPDDYLLKAYSSCAFTVFPSVEEGFGLPIVESLWFGKPCVCANFGAMGEVGIKGGCILIDTRNEDEIEAAMVSLINDQAFLHQLYEKIPTLNLETWNDYAKKLTDSFKSYAITQGGCNTHPNALSMRCGLGVGLKAKRIFWLGMHKILVHTELKRLRNLGYEVFYPPYLTDVVDQSADMNWDANQETTLPPAVFTKLASTNFFYSTVGDDVYEILNEYFGTVIVTIAPPWLETILNGFNGKVIYRTYGQAHSLSVEVKNRGLLPKISGNKSFVLMPHALETLTEEETWLRENERVVPYCLTDDIFGYQDSWDINIILGGEIALTCPNIANSFFHEHYKFLKENYNKDYFRMYGVQTSIIDDPAVVGSLQRHELVKRWIEVAAYVYTYTDPRVCYLPPIEFMVIGVPVLFARGSLLDKYFAVDTPARFDTPQQAISLCERIRSGDKQLVTEIVGRQHDIRKRYTPSFVWPIFDKAIRSEIKY